MFDQWWTNTRFNTFVASISEHDDNEDNHGRLSMWRGFGGANARVRLVLKLPWVSGAGVALNLLFSPVAYLTEKEAHGVIFETIGNIKAHLNYGKLTNCRFS
jgi:hypothetical protein